MKQIALSEIKDELSQYLHLAEKEEVIITRHGRPAGVLIGFASEDDWFDYRLEHDPRFLLRIKRARQSLRQGKGVKLEEIEKDGGGTIGRRYPDWMDDTPNVDASAKISRSRRVANARVIRVENASYRRASLTGVLELEDQSGFDPIETKPSGKRKVRVICAWHGVIPPTTYPQVDVTNAKCEILDHYTGQVADNIS